MFKAVPKTVNQKIHFTLDDKGLAAWLHNLHVAEGYTSCKAIFQLIQSINALDLNAGKKISILEKINENLSLYVDRVEENFLDSCFPLNAEERAYVEIIVWLYYELARGFFQTVDKIEGWGKKRQAAVVLFRALHSLGQALLYMSEVYTKPFDGFWLLCYQIFAKAEEMKVLDLEVKVGANKEQTVQNMFNHILVFELSGTNQFRTRDIKKIYYFFAQVAGHAKVVSELEQKYAKSYCIFDLAIDAPPGRNNSTEKNFANTVRFITTVIIAKKIYKQLQENALTSEALNSINHTLFLKVVNTLGMAQTRKNTRIKKIKPCKGVIGLNNLISLLSHNSTQDDQQISVSTVPEQEKNKKQFNDRPLKKEPFVREFDPRIAGQWEAPDLDLVPVGEETAHQLRETYKTRIWHDKKLNKIFSIDDELPGTNKKKPSSKEKSISFQGFDIVDSSVHGLRILSKSDDLEVKTGDIFGIAADFSGRVELGLVCRVDNSYTDGISLGIKMISLETKVVQMCKVKQKKTAIWALFLPGSKSIQPADSVVFNSSHFKSGDYVCLLRDGKEIRCQLRKQLNSTAAITHLEVYYPDDPSLEVTT